MGNHVHTMLMRSRDLRKHMTAEERHLYYDGLKSLPWKFRRQVVFGDYIVDFYCPQLKLVIEVDGTQHFLDVCRSYDEKRDEVLRMMGLMVLRYSNADVNLRFNSVMSDIYEAGRKRESGG